MAVTQNTYTGNGSTVLFSFTFPYLETTDIKVSVNGTITTAYTLANATTIQFNTAPANGAAIRIYRVTDDSALAAQFYPGSAIRSQDLNDNFTQNLYVTQEVNNNALNVDGSNPMVGNLNMNGYQIDNLGEPTSNSDAATKKYIDDRYGNLSIPGFTRWSKTAVGGETTLSGVGTTGGTLGYSPNREQVYLNGAQLQRDADYTANNGTSIVLNVALIAGDVLEVICVNNLNTGTTAQAQDVYWNQSGTGATTRTVESKLRDVVSIRDFGGVGNGIADDSNAFKLACDAAVSSNRQLILPTGTYKFTNGVIVNLPLNSNLSIDGMGSTIVLDTPSTFWEQIQIKNSTASNGCTVLIRDLTIKGINGVAATYWGAATATYRKNIGLLVESTKVYLDNLVFQDIWGKALNVGYINSGTFNNLKFLNVGGHSYTYAMDAYGNEDSFGDAIYFNRIDGQARVDINNFYARGMTSTGGPGASGAGGGLSRIGICVELAAASGAALALNVSNMDCANFERTFHVESIAGLTLSTNINLDGANISNTALLFHSYLATLAVNTKNIIYSANTSVAFNVDSFFIQQASGTIANSIFYSPTKCWNGATTDVPSGTNLTFIECDLYYNDARHHGKNCSVTFNHCRIYDYNDDASNATMSVNYNHCEFSTTMPATYENTLSNSSGTEVFNHCAFTNQRPSIAKVIQNSTYRLDQGIAAGSCIRVNNATTDIPRIRNAIYRVMEVDTGVTRLGYVTDTGSVYAPGAIPAIQAGSTASTIRVGSGVTFSAFVEIAQHQKL
jgi:hypothetical protein